jgi:hypothetical protein
MTELNGTGITAMFTADTELDPRTGLSTAGDGLLHQGPHPFSIEHREGIGFQNVRSPIKIDELCGIITGETERGLGEVVRPE